MLIKQYNRLARAKKILLGTSILVSIFFCFLLVQQKKEPDGNIIFLLDISHSMNVVDVQDVHGKKISRLDAAKEIVQTSIAREKEPRKRGIIVFGQQVSYFVPPTTDTETLLYYMQTLHTNYLPGGGTNLQKAIPFFLTTKKSSDIGILITDGGSDEVLSGNISSLHIIHIGSEEGGIVRYPNGEIMKNEKNEPIIVARNDTWIEKLPHGVSLVSIDTLNGNEGDHILSQIISPKDRRRYRTFLALAIILVL